MSFVLPFREQIAAAGLPTPIGEYAFALSEGRQWRFDWCWPDKMLAVECDGGTWQGGRHTRGKGYENDCRKLNEAVLLGWRVLRFTTGQVESGEALRVVTRALQRG